MKPLIATLIAIAFVAVLLWVGWLLLPQGTHYVDENERCGGVHLFADRMSLIVDTYTSPWRPADTPERKADIRTYLITGRLGGEGEVADLEVIGPLSQLRGSASSMALSGVPFNAEDRRLMDSMSYFRFGSDGRLWRAIYADNSQNVQELTLELTATTARWNADPS